MSGKPSNRIVSRQTDKRFAATRLWVLALLLLTACSKTSNVDQPPAGQPPSEEPPAVAATGDPPPTADMVSIPLDRMGLVSERLHREPAKSAWAAETFNDRAAAQLKRLKSALLAAEAGDASLAKLAHRNFRCGPLRPAELRTVFDGDALLVRRAAQAASATANNGTYRGAEGLREALRELAAPFSQATNRHALAKIVAVRFTDGAIDSTVAFQLSGRLPDGTLQVTANWRCQWHEDADQTLRLTSLSIEDYEETWGRSNGSSLFADCTESVLGNNDSFRQQLCLGIDHWTGRIESRLGMTPSGWQGVTLGDVNGDGLDDVYVCQPAGLPNRLYLQLPDGTATDVSAASGADWWDHSQTALLLDLDNDGDQDLVLATTLGLIFMANDGQGQFTVAATKLCPEAAPLSLSAADFDQDGDLDVYAGCYSLRGVAITAGFLARPMPYHDANNGGRNALYRNDRNWRFRNVTRQVGLEENNRRFTLAAAWEDYDNDGDDDLYVANDYGRNNLYRNDGGRFVDVAAQAGVEDISAGMSVSWGDYNGDGRMDLYVSNMWSSAGNRITYQRQFQRAADAQARSDFQRHARGNSLFLNAGDGTFRDVSQSAHVTMGRWAWGSRFFDMNNDSLRDLIVANGFITQDDTSDL